MKTTTRRKSKAPSTKKSNKRQRTARPMTERSQMTIRQSLSRAITDGAATYRRPVEKEKTTGKSVEPGWKWAGGKKWFGWLVKKAHDEAPEPLAGIGPAVQGLLTKSKDWRADFQQREEVQEALPKFLADHTEYVPQAWVAHLTGATRQAVTKAIKSGRLETIVYPFPDGTTVVLVDLKSALRIA